MQKPQENASKGTYNKDHTTMSKSARMLQHSKLSARGRSHRIREKTNAVMSIDTEKASDKIQRPFVKRKPGTDATASIICSGEVRTLSL
jgi:hypothetical protein